MILKKDVSSYVIWALFAAFNVLLIALFGLYSGLFPTSDTTETMLFAGLFTVLVGGTCLVVSFLIDKLSVYFMQDKRINSNLIYWILFILVLIGGIGLRSYILYSEGFFVRSGNILFETATVTNGGIIKADSIWKLFYLMGMRTVLYLTGDVLTAALIYQLVIRILFFILIAVAARIMTGRVSSVIVLSLLMFLPPFITVHSLDAVSFFELFVALELTFLALYFKCMTRVKPVSVGGYFLFILLGIGLGAMFYMDAGTVLFWSPMLLLLFVFKKIKEVLLSFLCILPGAVAGFMLILICWDGYNVIVPALNRWSSKYFADILSIESFEVIGESSSSSYAVLYLVLAIVMLCSTFAFLFHKKTTRLSPVMLQALLVCLVAPVMGETNVNTLRMMTLMCILVIGGGIACMLTSYDTSDFDVLLGKENDEPAAEFDDWADLEDADSDYALLKGSGDDDSKSDDAGAEDAQESENKKTMKVVTPEKKEDGEAEKASSENEEIEKVESEKASSENEETTDFDNTDSKTESLEKTVIKSEDFEENKDNSSEPLAKTDDLLENTTETIVAEANSTTVDNFASDNIREVLFDTEEKYDKDFDKNSDINFDKNSDKSVDKSSAVRFVPEGMVVPMDTEEDEETPRPGRRDILERRRNMAKMQSPSGKLKVGRKVIVNREFDLEATDGDDFDLF
ncbi:hypothetical protein SAMN02745229_02314 [Butyrivibrio fibrisolvens DSM 3071]|uniref:Uncharacterized protein n=1 Tax=Butyrivibrio fibrisolvens DSM 3071 TaxID=1121131 RepID=A0A1M5ZJ55_BUTFI|nr:hypothetical protein [Butyrivibrio fibrisolvens]SHI24159.1 hypothetical protein SAMN02745229_02314 [Butyrivibrio fibrisolvens DSM 3071]